MTGRSINIVYDGFIVGYMMLVERIEILPDKKAPT
jgi:hypothetical protein